MASLTLKTRERIYSSIEKGWSTERIVNRFNVTPGTVAAFRANWTRSQSLATAPSAPKARKNTTTNRLPMQFSVPRSALSVSYKGSTAHVSISLG